ncbi:MAG: maleylacetoacetate isomerase [Caulobacter sp.]|nr:maleylacetoacetate isomerase [Caulobacter sp.]
MQLRLHGYWRSTAAYRVRIALALKGLDVEQATIDLRKAEQGAAGYRAIQPQGLVPALEVDGRVLIQSLPIIEWLDEVFPQPPLLPRDPFGRAHVRALAAIVASDMHPLNNLRVLKRLREDLHASEPAVTAWISEWSTRGFVALEALLPARGWSFGDQPGLADCCLIPQVYSAQRFDVDLTPFPKVRRIAALASEHPAFRLAHPDRQPDADRPAS